MTVLSRRWGRSATVVATGAAALVGAGIFAVPASAHTPTWTLDCSTVSVDLTNYNAGVTNTVTLTADGKDLLPSQDFGRDFHKKIDLPKHSSALPVRLVVKAGDGSQYSRDETKTSPVCEGQSPTPTKPPTSPSPSTSTAPSQSPSSSAPAPVPSASESSAPGDLAETGSSSSTPMIAGAAGVVLLAGAGVLVVSRKRRSAQH